MSKSATFKLSDGLNGSFKEASQRNEISSKGKARRIAGQPHQCIFPVGSVSGVGQPLIEQVGEYFEFRCSDHGSLFSDESTIFLPCVSP